MAKRPDYKNITMETLMQLRTDEIRKRKLVMEVQKLGLEIDILSIQQQMLLGKIQGSEESSSIVGVRGNIPDISKMKKPQ
jgi:hypothetical protein